MIRPSVTHAATVASLARITKTFALPALGVVQDRQIAIARQEPMMSIISANSATQNYVPHVPQAQIIVLPAHHQDKGRQLANAGQSILKVQGIALNVCRKFVRVVSKVNLIAIPARL